MSRDQWQSHPADSSRSLIRHLQSALDRTRSNRSDHEAMSVEDANSMFERPIDRIPTDEEITLFDSTLHGYFRPEAQIDRVREAIRQEIVDKK